MVRKNSPEKKGRESESKPENIPSKSARSKEEPTIRELLPSELDGAAELVARLKRLNGEFDPLLKTIDGVEAEAKKVLASALQSKDSLVLVALEGKKVVGIVKADLVGRVFYEPLKEGAIVEFYILPEFRRGSLGNELLDSMVTNLKDRGAILITAEFPSQNEIAKKFYTKLGFRSLTNVYAKSY